MAEAATALPSGVVVVDKDAGWTSHDVVAKSRGLLGTKKVGHAGTLDPDATGVLVLGVGQATRLLRYAQLLPKTYVAEIVLGVETTTLDAAGEVTATYDMTHVQPEEVRAASAKLTGDLLQVPPMVSAVKVGGRRLHELARAGIEVERQARPVHVARFDVDALEGEPGVYRAEIDCSSGTYVRVLAADLGAALGGGAHLRSLRRTAVGPYTLQGAVRLESLSVEDLRPPRDAVSFLSQVVIDAELAGRVRTGAVLAPDELGATGGGPWAVLDEAGSLLAVYEPHRAGSVKPAVVLPGA